MLCTILLGCTADDILPAGGGDGQSTADADIVGQPVLFTSGNVMPAMTRAGVPYMSKDGRFVCTMYYHPMAGATDSSPYDIRPHSSGGTMTTAWLKVHDNVGNSVYRIASFDESNMNEDPNLHFDNNATMFYWQNRLPHAFLALTDYHRLTTNVGNTTKTAASKGTLKMFPFGDGETDSLNVYDLTRGDTVWQEKDGKRVYHFQRDTITDLPDPLLALTIQKPEGATQEANRVRLYFKHQFSQIQVNLKGADDGSASLTADQIEKVELLGVSTEGYVVNVLNANGTVGTGEKPLGHKDDKGNPDEDIMLGAASAKEVDLDQYTDAELTANRWGTSLEMFDMAGRGAKVDLDGDGRDDRYEPGYLKSFNAIAFGQLWGIRVTWKEEGTSEVRHVSTFEVPITNESSSSESSSSTDEKKPVVFLRQLQSGIKYIYNLELRRGTLAIIRTLILDWKQEAPLVYGTDGTITN